METADDGRQRAVKWEMPVNDIRVMARPPSLIPTELIGYNRRLSLSLYFISK